MCGVVAAYGRCHGSERKARRIAAPYAMSKKVHERGATAPNVYNVRRSGAVRRPNDSPRTMSQSEARAGGVFAARILTEVSLDQ